MGHPAGIVMFSFVAVIMLVVTAATVRLARKRGHRLELLDFALQLGGLLWVLAVTVELPRAAKIAIVIAGCGLWLYALWGHFRRVVPRR
jgi:hypothetical protein